MANEGSFIPQKRHDILVEAIRKMEYDGCVCNVGEGINLVLFFV